MKKLSNINESVWGDIYKRGAGEQVRQEDKIFSKEELDVRIREEYNKQNTAKTHIIDLTMLNVSLIDDMSKLFLDKCMGVTTIDISNWDVSNVKDMSDMFWGCKSLQVLNVSNWNVSNVTNMSNMFWGCKSLQTLNVSNWDVSNVKIMKNMFHSCELLQTIDVSNWDVSNVQNMGSMFNNCSSLETLNVSKWNVSNVKDMSYMFYECKKLQTLNVSNWDVSNVEDMGEMFWSCKSLQTLDISNWNVSNVLYMNNMFSGCSSLKTLDVSNWGKRHQKEIPDEFKKINESIWGDIYKRGAGEQERKEDIPLFNWAFTINLDILSFGNYYEDLTSYQKKQVNANLNKIKRNAKKWSKELDKLGLTVESDSESISILNVNEHNLFDTIKLLIENILGGAPGFYIDDIYKIISQEKIENDLIENNLDDLWETCDDYIYRRVEH